MSIITPNGNKIKFLQYFSAMRLSFKRKRTEHTPSECKETLPLPLPYLLYNNLRKSTSAI